MSGQTKVLSVHRDRDVARRQEDALQAWLDSRAFTPLPSRLRHLSPIPPWVRGVRVERVGFFRRPAPGFYRRLGVQWVVVATEHRGH